MSYKHIPYQVNVKPSSYGIVTDKRGWSSIVLTDKEGHVLIRTESFRENKQLQNALRSLDQLIPNELNYCFRENARGQSYFIIRAGNGYSLAISETFTDRQQAQNAAESVREISKYAQLFRFRPISRPMDE